MGKAKAKGKRKAKGTIKIVPFAIIGNLAILVVTAP
jgi:hypothetical protein